MFSYSGDPSASTLDAVRFYSQDIQEDDPFLSDEEINFIVSTWVTITDNPLYLAAAACDVIASKFAREISFSADGVSVGASELQEKYERLADSLRAQYTASEVGGGPDAGGLLANEVPDYTVKPLVWAKGQHDNPSAGQQDFGGSGAPPNYFPENWVN